MVGYDFENVSHGFWVVSGAGVGYILFLRSVYHKSQQEYFYFLMFCLLYNRTFRQDG